MNRLEIPHVAYSLTQEGGYPYSICEDFITPDTELISAWHIMQTMTHLIAAVHLANLHDLPELLCHATNDLILHGQACAFAQTRQLNSSFRDCQMNCNASSY